MSFAGFSQCRIESRNEVPSVVHGEAHGRLHHDHVAMDTVHETNDFVILQQTVKEGREGKRDRESEATRAARGDGC